MKKTEDIEHKENPYYTRYILESKDNALQKSDEEFIALSGTKFVNPNPDLNKGNERCTFKFNEKATKDAPGESRQV